MKHLNALIPLAALVYMLHPRTLLHETSHLLMGLAVGMRPFAVRIGNGPSWTVKIGKTFWFSIGVLPFGGFTVALPFSEDGTILRAIKTRMALYILAGPLFELLVLAAVVWLSIANGSFFNLFWLNAVLAMNFLMNAIPRSFNSNGAKHNNDGKVITALLRSDYSQQIKDQQKAVADNLSRYMPPEQAAVLTSKGEIFCNTVRLRSLESLGLHDAYVKELERLLAQDTVTSGEFGFFSDLLCSMVMTDRGKRYLAKADRYSALAVEKNPAVLTVLGTRGAVLYYLHRHGEAIVLLEKVVRLSDTEIDQVVSYGFLARSYHALGAEVNSRAALAKAFERAGPLSKAFASNVRQGLFPDETDEQWQALMPAGS